MNKQTTEGLVSAFMISTTKHFKFYSLPEYKCYDLQKKTELNNSKTFNPIYY